ncbi:MAG TPA: MOSC domain-containing protein [Gemmatimonadales bacterium]|jgi:MOSC domain-containing protein YiiM
MRLVSVQVGTPRTVGTPGAEDRMERAFTSAIWKSPVSGPVFAGALGLAGDAVANPEVHGGIDQAVLMYAAAHYPLWRADLGRELSFGAFGENLTVDGLDESSVCIGDVLQIGAVTLEVSQPRQPCATLARRHQVPNMVAIVRGNGRSGWYVRVLVEGHIEAGQTIRLAQRPNPSWTVRRTAQTFLAREREPTAAVELSRCSALSQEWRSRLAAVRPVL